MLLSSHELVVLGASDACTQKAPAHESSESHASDVGVACNEGVSPLKAHQLARAHDKKQMDPNLDEAEDKQRRCILYHAGNVAVGTCILITA